MISVKTKVTKLTRKESYHQVNHQSLVESFITKMI